MLLSLLAMGLVLHLLVKPYNIPLANTMDTIALSSLCVGQFALLLVSMAGGDVFPVGVLFILVMVVAAMMYIYLLVRLFI